MLEIIQSKSSNATERCGKTLATQRVPNHPNRVRIDRDTMHTSKQEETDTAT